MSLNSDLQTLKTNIEGVKSTLYTNLTNKGVTDITESDTLSTLANKVSTITTSGSGGSVVDFSQIGYSDEISEKAIENINNDIAYSKFLLDSWNPSNTSANGLYKVKKKLVYAPAIDTSNVTDMSSMFDGCLNLKTVPLYNTSKVTGMTSMFSGCTNIKTVQEFDTINVTTMRYMFSSCTFLTSVPLFDTRNVTDMYAMFSYCSELKSVPLFDTSSSTNLGSMFSSCSSITTIPAFDTSNVTNMDSMFNGCKSLKIIPAFDTSKVTSFDTIFYNCSKLTTIEGISFKSFSDSTMSSYYLVGYSSNNSIRKAVFKDIGYQSTAVQFNAEYIANWGVNTSEIADARQSLIDSLITYSFDRASAGYPTCTIKLSSNTKALLTEDEKTQITAKGFVIA